MTKVNCPTIRCRNNVDLVCKLDEMHRVTSYGRSTDYVEVILCEEDTTR